MDRSYFVRDDDARRFSRGGEDLVDPPPGDGPEPVLPLNYPTVGVMVEMSHRGGAEAHHALLAPQYAEAQPVSARTRSMGRSARASETLSAPS